MRVDFFKSRGPGRIFSAIRRQGLVIGFVLLLIAGPSACFYESKRNLEPAVTLLDPAATNQDDMCIWGHPKDPALSTVIVSDKKAEKLFVYDLEGTTIHSVNTPKPGNIDVRYGFPLGGRKVDIVAFNQRAGDYKVVVFGVDPASRRLERIDNGAITVKGKNSGGTLYHSAKTGSFYFFVTSYAGTVEQFELMDDGTGRVGGRKVRSWTIGLCEAAVADDEAGVLYVAEEQRGVWQVGAEPDDSTPGTLALNVGDHGLQADVEGLAIYRKKGGEGYLVASSQGSNTFNVYERGGSHAYVETFSVKGAKDTDGIDIAGVSLNARFPRGLFACHSGAKRPYRVFLIPWEAVEEALKR